jgi:hypothetical protein
MALERSQRGLQLWLRPRRDPTPQSELWQFKVPGVPPGQLRDSISGVPTKCAIRVPPPRSNAEYTTGSKVVAYSRVRAVVSLVVRSARASPNT